MKKVEEAFEKYLDVAFAYYNKGFVPQALSLSKILYDLKPDDPRVEDLIKMLTGSPPEPAVEEITAEGAEEAKEPAEEKTPKKKPLKIPKILFFSSLSNEEFIDVLRHLNRHVFPAGDVILEQGERAKAIYLLTSGEARVEKSENGEVRVLKTLGPGSFIGQYSFFAKTPLPASVMAESDCEVLEVSEKHLKEISRKYPQVQKYVENLYFHHVFLPTLSNIPLFRDLNEDDLQEIAKRFVLVKVEKGDHVIIEGTPGEAFYVIRSGAFVVSRGIGGGKRVRLAELREGDFFGEIALLTDDKTTATVTALKKSELMKIEKERFKEILLMYPTIMDTVTRYMEERLADTKKKVREALEEEGII